MYAQRFGLSREPFSIAPDPRFLYMSERHREALAHLLFGLQGGGGFVLLTGEIGAGKTTVCRCFLERVPAHCNVAYVFNPRLTELELLGTVCDEFHIAAPRQPDGTPATTAKPWIDALNAFLLDAHAQGRQNVLVIDEAQNLAPGVLEQLRLLTNLETAERKLLQIMLIGQPELREMLATPALAPLAQRVIARYHLQALDAAECEAYIRHRLGVAGLTGALPFDAAALRRIHALTRGVPRRINLLCDRALLGAYGGGHASIGRAIVDQAAAEVFDAAAGELGNAPPRRSAAGAWRAGAALLVAAGVAGTATLLAQRAAGPAGLAASPRAAPATAASAASSATALADPPGSAPAAAGATRRTAMTTPPAPATAGRASPAPADTVLRVADLRPWFDRLPRDEAAAWRALWPHWPAAAAAAALPASGAAAGDSPCAAAQPLRCQRAQLTLAQIRTLDRPGLLVLRPSAGPPAYVLLRGLAAASAAGAGADAAEAWLQVDEQRLRVPLAELARWWQGEFLTLWQAPAGLPPGWQRGGEQVERWLDGQLRQLPGASAEADVRSARSRIAGFQLASGLKPDGVAGPMTLMQLNRAAGIAEPHLQTEP